MIIIRLIVHFRISPSLLICGGMLEVHGCHPGFMLVNVNLGPVSTRYNFVSQGILTGYHIGKYLGNKHQRCYETSYDALDSQAKRNCLNPNLNSTKKSGLELGCILGNMIRVVQSYRTTSSKGT